MPLVVVFGAGGGTGLAAVHRCIALGHSVRAVVRSPEAHAGRMPAGAELVAGDVTDAASVAAALAGAHGAVFAASTSSFLSADAVDHQARRGARRRAARARAATFALTHRCGGRACAWWRRRPRRRAFAALC